MKLYAVGFHLLTLYFTFFKLIYNKYIAFLFTFFCFTDRYVVFINVRLIWMMYSYQWQLLYSLQAVQSLICTWINGWVNNRKAGDLSRHRAHYDVTLVAFQGGYGWPKLQLQHSRRPHNFIQALDLEISCQQKILSSNPARVYINR